MKPTIGTFLVGALVGAALALGVRAAILSWDDGSHGGHGDPGAKSGVEEPPAPPVVAEEAPKGFLIDLGNENCPIMGNPVSGRTFSEWNGLRIGHCCPPCIEDLLAAPEKSLDDAGIEWRVAAKVVAAVKAASAGSRMALIEEAKKKYTVVRMPAGHEGHGEND